MAGTCCAITLLGSPTISRRPLSAASSAMGAERRRAILQHEQPAFQADQAILRRPKRLLQAAENGKRLDALAGGVAHRVGDLAAQLLDRPVAGR